MTAATHCQQLLDQILREAKTHGMTQRELCQAAGIAPETLSRIRRSGATSYATLHALAACVDLRPALEPTDYLQDLTSGRLLE